MKLSDPQHRVLRAMVGSVLKKSGSGWVARGGSSPCAESTRFKLIDLGMIQRTDGRGNEFELTEEGYRIATASLRGEK